MRRWGTQAHEKNVPRMLVFVGVGIGIGIAFGIEIVIAGHFDIDADTDPEIPSEHSIFEAAHQ